MRYLAIFFLASSLTLQAEPGFYSLGTITGNGAREWNTNGILDNHGNGHGADFDMSSNMFLSDTLQAPGEIVLKEDGTLTAKWSHKIELTYNYQPDFYQPEDVWGDDDGTTRFDFDEQYFWNLDFGPYSDENNPNPVNELSVTLNTEATGTWSGGGGSLNLSFDCDVDSTSTITYLPEKSTETVTETLTNQGLPVSFSATGTCSEGSISFTWDTLDVWLPALRDAYYTGDKEVAVEDALREGVIELEGENTDDYVNQEVKKWSYMQTQVRGTPLGGDLQAKYTQYYLLDVDAPYGFYVFGDYGSAEGMQQARFIYGGQQVTRSIESGYAEDGQLSYGEPPDMVEVEILSDGAVTDTLQLPLIKVPVSAWAGSAGDFSASPGVTYTRAPLDWPISLVCHRHDLRHLVSHRPVGDHRQRQLQVRCIRLLDRRAEGWGARDEYHFLDSKTDPVALSHRLAPDHAQRCWSHRQRQLQHQPGVCQPHAARLPVRCHPRCQRHPREVREDAERGRGADHRGHASRGGQWQLRRIP